jgi:hypothetical protein
LSSSSHFLIQKAEFGGLDEKNGKFSPGQMPQQMAKSLSVVWCRLGGRANKNELNVNLRLFHKTAWSPVPDSVAKELKRSLCELGCLFELKTDKLFID